MITIKVYPETFHCYLEWIGAIFASKDGECPTSSAEELLKFFLEN